MTFCYGCMQPKQQTVCEHCGHLNTSNNSEDALPIGLTLLNRYVIGSQKKGRGADSYSCTYFCWDKQKNRRAEIQEFFPMSSKRHGDTRTAILPEKILHWDILTFAQMGISPARWHRSPHIEHIYDFFYDNGTFFIVRELIDGISLYEYIKKLGRPLTVAESIRFLLQTADILKQLHSLKIYHTGLNPDNIIIHNNGNIILTDFGNLNCVLDDQFNPLWKFEEPAHLACPLSIDDQGIRNDIYFLRTVFDFCLTGVYPTYATLDDFPELDSHQKTALGKAEDGSYNSITDFINDFSGKSLRHW